MAYDSAFWDGTSTGHAASTDIWSAPYSSGEYSDIYNKLLGSAAAKGYVIPTYGTGLAIAANNPVAMNVLVGTGAMFIRGKLFENTAQATLTIATADATNPRIDRIVVRISFAAQTIELAVLAGTPAATPALPTLTQNATTYEIPIAYVWVAATAASIAATEVHDERVFAANLEGLLTTLMQPNLLSNSEFMAFSGLDTLTFPSKYSPDCWATVGTVTTFANLTKPSQMSRGRAVKITAGAGSSGMSQTQPVRASTVYSIKGLVQVTAGDVASIVVTTNSASPGTVTKYIRRTGSWIEYTIFYATEADASTLTLSLLGLNNTDVVDFGQWLVVEGRIPGPFRQIHEIIYLDSIIYDSSFFGDNYTTTGITTLNLNTTGFQGLILQGTQALYLRHETNSNASETAIALLHVISDSGYTGSRDYSYHQTLGLDNSIMYMSSWWVPVAANREVYVRRAVGAGTMNTSLGVFGISI